MNFMADLQGTRSPQCGSARPKKILRKTHVQKKICACILAPSSRSKDSRMPRRALLVEDDQSLQIAMRYLMENLGFDLVSAETREDAVRNIAEGPYDIAIVDYYLRNVPSSDLIADMRRRFPRMPIICSTAARRENLQLD